MGNFHQALSLTLVHLPALSWKCDKHTRPTESEKGRERDRERTLLSENLQMGMVCLGAICSSHSRKPWWVTSPEVASSRFSQGTHILSIGIPHPAGPLLTSSQRVRPVQPRTSQTGLSCHFTHRGPGCLASPRPQEATCAFSTHVCP